jgi:hypothetical protein
MIKRLVRILKLLFDVCLPTLGSLLMTWIILTAISSSILTAHFNFFDLI